MLLYGKEWMLLLNFIKNHWKGLTVGLIVAIVSGVFALVFKDKD